MRYAKALEILINKRKIMIKKPEEVFEEENNEKDEDYPITDYELSSNPNDFNVLTLTNFIDRGVVKIPNFQRNYVWDQSRASKLIESLLIGLPVPQIFFYEEDKNSYLVIDGQQRLMSIYYYIKGRFPRDDKRVELREIINNEKKLTKEGIEIYTNTRMEAHKKVCKTWNYQEHVTNGNYIYVLYFSIAGFEDLEWQVVRFKKEKWKNQEKIDKELLEKLQYKVEDNLVKVDDLDFVPLFSNYDEMPKNIENIKLFIKNQYLVLERGNLYHSLFDLKIQKTILNFECPWCESKATDKESMNSWIKENLHNPIEVKINASH